MALQTEPMALERLPLTRQRVLAAAVDLADDAGIDGLSMRRVAEALGTGPASLYAHVSGKEELLELMLDRLAGGVVVPDPDPDRWQEQVKDCVRAIYREFVARPGLAAASLGKIPTGPGTMVTIDRFLGLLRAGGLPDRVVAYAADILTLYATAYAFEQGIYAERMSGDAGARYLGEIGTYFGALPADRFPNIAALREDLLAGGEGDERFEFGLEMLVAGIAAER